MSEFVSVERINSLKSGIEAKTGESYGTLTAGVQALVDGYGVGSAPVLSELEITENGEYTPPDGVDGFSKVTANVAGSGGTSANLFQTADIVVDNTTVTLLSVELEDDTLDNYAMEAIMIESGVYTDGVLTLDETPTVPMSQNTPVQCCGVNLKSQLSVSVNLGDGQTFTGYQNSGCYVIRNSVSTFSGDYVYISEGKIGIKSQYAWGKAGYYFKFRVNVYGWNNP